MQKYDIIIDELHETINDYKKNLEQLKDKFNDVKTIVEHLESLSGSVDQTNKSIDDILEKMLLLNNKNSEITSQFTNVTDKVSESMSYFNIASNKWSESLNLHFQKIYEELNIQQVSFQQTIEKVFGDLVNIADKELVSMDGYFQSVLAKTVEEIESFQKESKGFFDELDKTFNQYFTSIQNSITITLDNQKDLQSSINTMNEQITLKFSELKNNQVNLLKKVDDTINPNLSAIQKSIIKISNKQQSLEASLNDVGQQFAQGLSELKNEQLGSINEFKNSVNSDFTAVQDSNNKISDKVDNLHSRIDILAEQFTKSLNELDEKHTLQEFELKNQYEKHYRILIIVFSILLLASIIGNILIFNTLP